MSISADFLLSTAALHIVYCACPTIVPVGLLVNKAVCVCVCMQ